MTKPKTQRGCIMRITEMIADLEAQEDERLKAAESISPLKPDPVDPRLRAIVAKLKKKSATRMLKQQLSADPEMRPILKNLSLGYAEE